MGSGSNVEGVRRQNLGTILRLVHRGGGLSRAALTQQTGLNRSTVGALVVALAERGFVTEREPDPTRRVGRPSPTVVPSRDIVAIAVNPEVDALEIGAVELGGSVRARVREDLDHLLTPEETARRVADAVSRWRRDELATARIVGAGVAVPGLVRASDGVVRNAPHLGWRDVDLASLISAASGIATVIGNDASLGAISEWLFGAARQHADVVYLNGGASGIGGGVILGGQSIGGASGYAGEWGQNSPSITDDDDRRVSRGTLEDEVNRARLFEATGVHDDASLAAALASPPAGEVARQRRILAASLANAANALNPSMIVLGGFLASLRDADPDEFDDDVRAHLLHAPAEDLTLSGAALGGDRLLIGAAELVFETLVADPLR